MAFSIPHLLSSMIVTDSNNHKDKENSLNMLAPQLLCPHTPADLSLPFSLVTHSHHSLDLISSNCTLEMVILRLSVSEPYFLSSSSLPSHPHFDLIEISKSLTLPHLCCPSCISCGDFPFIKFMFHGHLCLCNIFLVKSKPRGVQPFASLSFQLKVTGENLTVTVIPLNLKL